MTFLTKEQMEILRHTYYRAAGRAYCGSSKDMLQLVEKGLMRSLGFKPGVPDEYFTLTPEGLNIATAPNPIQYPQDCPYARPNGMCSCTFTPTGRDREMTPGEIKNKGLAICLGLPGCTVYGTPKGGYRR